MLSKHYDRFNLPLYAMNIFFLGSYDFEHYVLGSSHNSISFLRLLPLVLYSKDKKSDGHKPLHVNQSLLPFEIEVESKKPWEIEIDGYNYSHIGMRIHLHRHDLGLLMGGFYIPMALFSTLSLISFSVNPEMVSINKILFLKLMTANRW